MKVAVTGASGFVGTHVVSELLGRDGVVVTTSGRGENGPFGTRCGHLACDLMQPDDPALAALAAHDVLIHLAWGGLPNYRSLSHLELELPRQYRLLTSLAQRGLPRVVCAGTCLEYGLCDGALDADRQTAPATAYALAKDVLRRQLTMGLADTSCDLVWARLFYMYGARQAPSALYSLLRRAVVDGDKEFAMSSGEQLRDFMPVELVARDIVSLALTPSPSPIVNICSGQPRSVRSMVEQWLDEWGATIELKRGVYPMPDYESLAFWGVRGPGLDLGID
ncbi:MAG: NAD-dependent epimerase/dehydratase family protein [Sphingomonas sp.]